MSLLDDVSIVVTPNGYKAGELYAVVPVPTEGSEEVTNGDFATDTDWTKGAGWTISGGTANCDGTSNSSLYQDISGVENTRYIITLTVSSYTSGTLQIGGSTNNLEVNSNGTFIHYRTWTNDSLLYLKSKSGDGFNGSISNVSVKEYTAADMDVTRATAATRVDEAGLVNYAEILGSEGININSFASASNWSVSGTDIIASGTTALFQQPFTLGGGKNFKITIVVDSITSGNFEFWVGDYSNDTPTISSANTYTYYVESGGSLLYMGFNPHSNLIATISSVSVKEVTRDNVPRIDYTGGGCPHILAEPQRTNLLTYSSDLSQWSLKQATETLNYGISPDGTQNSTRLVFASGNLQFSNIFTTVTPTTGSIYMKGIVGETVSFGMQSSEGLFTFDGSWQRFERIGTATSNKITVNTYNSATARDFEVWGGQVEEGSYATSYIPTSGSTVTRNQDQFTRDGIGSLINSTEGVLFFESIALSDDEDTRISISDGTSNNFISIGYSRFSGNIIAEIFAGGVLQTLNWGANGVNKLIYHKFALSWGSGTMNFYMDGSISNTESVTSPTGLNILALDNGSGTLNFFGKLKQLQVYKTALTDAQLTSLTS